jgi:enterochelin esterase-like enzyme
MKASPVRSPTRWAWWGCMVWLWSLLMSVAQAAQSPQVSRGHLERLQLQTRFDTTPRNVDVWLPDGYAQRAAQGERFQVLYMHDGQMLFDASQTWNRQAWRVADALSELMDAGEVPPTLVVGVWNGGAQRHSEYFPQQALAHLEPTERDSYVQQALAGQPRADAYLAFLVHELKPLIDRRYATRSQREYTHVMGASMGGLISIYAALEYPHVFGGAAGLSTHWISLHRPNAGLPLALFRYLRQNLKAHPGLRLYQDHGDQELDALYAPYQPFVDVIVREKGFDDAHYQSLQFPGTGHNETAWAQRLHTPLRFLLRAR